MTPLRDSALTGVFPATLPEDDASGGGVSVARFALSYVASLKIGRAIFVHV